MKPWAWIPVRLGAYLYLTAGAIGLLLGFFTPFALILALALVAVNWESFRTPLSARRWVPLVAIASIGIARILFGGPAGGAGLS